jgi:hypothetical protein
MAPPLLSVVLGWKSRRSTGRPTTPTDVRALIRTMSQTNPRWGARLGSTGELLKLGIDVCQSTVAKYMIRLRQPQSQKWSTFLANHVAQIMAADFFVVPAATVYSAKTIGDTIAGRHAAARSKRYS